MILGTRCFTRYVLLLAAVTLFGCADAPTQLARSSTPQLDAVKFWEVNASTRWNERAITLLGQRPPGNAQAAASRILTYLSIAQHRAVLAAEAGKVGSTRPQTVPAPPPAAAAAISSRPKRRRRRSRRLME